MNKESELLKIDRKIAAKEAGLIQHGYKYNKKVDDDELCPERFYCRVDEWKPDENWNHFMYVKNRAAKGSNIILSEDTPKESFKLLMSLITK